MPFKPSIVAMPEDPSESPFLGFPLTEIVLEQPNGDSAAVPKIPAHDSRDKITEATTGSDVRVVRRKLNDVAFDIDFITTEKKERLERLIHDGRTVYLCPNVSPYTEFSFPLQRSLADFMGRKTVTCTRAEANYFWDATDKVLRSWEDDEPCFALNGKWQRYLRTTFATTNRAAKPHPDTGGVGWTGFAGSPTLTYTEEILSPVLSQRIVTNEKGVVVVEADAASSAVLSHTASSLDTTNDVIATVIARWHGSITFSLYGSPSLYDTVTLDGDGTWQVVRLGGANADSASTAIVYATLNETVGGSSTKQLAILGPTFIGNDNRAYGYPKLVDWHDGTSVQDEIAATDSNDLVAPEMTISFIAKLAVGHRTGFIYCGAALSAYINYGPTLVLDTPGAASPALFPNLDTVFSLSDGDWFHCVIRCSADGGLEVFINGVAHGANGTEPWEPENIGSTLKIGQVGTGAALDQSGMCHLRCDTVAWTDDQITDHYDTYFRHKGLAVIEPAFGKKMYIESMTLEPRPNSPDDHWIGDIVLRELGPDENFATMQRQEGDV